MNNQNSMCDIIFKSAKIFLPEGRIECRGTKKIEGALKRSDKINVIVSNRNFTLAIIVDDSTNTIDNRDELLNLYSFLDKVLNDD